MSDDEVSRKVALVTGGASGIGRAIVDALAKDHRMAITYRQNRGAAMKWAEASGGLAIDADLRDPDSVNRVAAGVRQRFGRLDVLVNNAASVVAGAADEPDLDAYRAMVEINLLAPLGLIGKLLPLMQDGGVILNITSVNARRPPPGVSAYAATKAGLEAATQALARELGHRSIRVNALAPGPIDVPSRQRSLEERERIVEDTALGRMGTPDEVARVARFLVSPEASWVTGEVLGVTGGFGL